ncbi:MAG TPA: hypothetical protein PLC99_24750, partial [Verrucomicrobiota bacterium]|nr:hypothetical protein [Verrucomicrobiota bacterium]
RLTHKAVVALSPAAAHNPNTAGRPRELLIDALTVAPANVIKAMNDRRGLLLVRLSRQLERPVSLGLPCTIS